MIVWSTPRGTLALPGLTSIRYGAAASTLPRQDEDRRQPVPQEARAEREERERGHGNHGERRRMPAQRLALDVPCPNRSPRTWRRPTATSRWTSTFECGELSDVGEAAGLDRADDLGLQRRLVLLEIERDLFVGHAPEQRPHDEPADQAGERNAIRTRKVMIEAGLNRHDSRPQADSTSASGAEAEHADRAAQHQLVAPAPPDLMDDPDQIRRILRRPLVQ